MVSATVTAPAFWPVAIYESERGIGLSVCVAHRGVHCWYLERCYPVGGGPASPIGPFRPCTLHEGRHLYVRGHCISPGRRYAYRYGRCSEDGCEIEICNRLDVLSGRTDRLDAESDHRHVHAPAQRVELDADAMATAIVAASRATREERRAQYRRPTAPATRQPSTTEAHGEPAHEPHRVRLD